MHSVLAHVTNSPELFIAPEEGDALAKAAQNVMRHYNVEASQKAIDWAALGMVAIGIYAPRIVAIAARRRATQSPPEHTNGAGDAPDIHFPADPSQYHTDGLQ